MKHTQGPWHIGRVADHSTDRFKRNCEWARIRSEQGGLIAKIESVNPKGKRQSCDFDIEAANVKLIAAAPDLLEALNRMIAMHDMMMKKVNHGASFYDAETIMEMNEAPIQANNAVFIAINGAK